MAVIVMPGELGVLLPESPRGKVESSNRLKYRTRNPLVRVLIARYFERLAALVASLQPASVLEAGCGEGEVLVRLREVLPPRVAGIDVSDGALSLARRRLPGAALSLGSVKALDFPSSDFDLVICVEVLEHLDDPGTALDELGRVARNDLVVSVPWEPWFRGGNLMRGRYLSSLGNHPDHLHRWSRRSFRACLGEHLEVVSCPTAFPWVLAHCRPR